MIISVIAGKGSPGATAAALCMTLSWPGPALLVEADPTGGSLVLGYAAGTDTGGRNLTGVRVAARRSGMADAIWANVVTLDENRWLLPGAETARQAESLDYSAIAAALASLGVDVIVDAGRVPAPVRHDALWATADVVLVAARSTLPAVHAAQAAATAAAELMSAAGSDGAADAAGSALRSIIIGAGRPYSERDICAAMADIAPVAGAMAWDPSTAGVLIDAMPPPRQIASTALMRSAARLAASLSHPSEPHRTATDQVERASTLSSREAPTAALDRQAVSAAAPRHSSRAGVPVSARTGGAA